ncbi:hypothetical protein BJX99DRAFT_228774 [Aspergillus californicus]
MVLTQLDLRSLSVFRRVNHRAMQAVDSIPQFKTITKHAIDVLRGILAIDSGWWISCQHLYNKLCTANCDKCGDFAGFLYLCFTKTPDFLPLSRPDAVRNFGLRPGDLVNVPAMQTVPGRYSYRGPKMNHRLTLFDHNAARQVGISVHDTADRMEQYASEMTSRKLERYQTRRLQQGTGAGKSTTRRPRTEGEFDGFWSNPKRFMAIVRAPFFDSRTGSLERGFHCAACNACKSDQEKPPFHWMRKFSEESFKDHITQCGEITDKNMFSEWVSRNEGLDKLMSAPRSFSFKHASYTLPATSSKQRLWAMTS